MKGQTVFETIASRHTTGVHPLIGPFDVLFMKALKCEWGGKCKYCTYWHDNTKSEVEAESINQALLNSVTLTTRNLSVSPSASWFDIPQSSRNYLATKFHDKIDNLISESSWSYREHFASEQAHMTISMPHTKFYHKMGVESFDNEVRAALGKNYIIPDPLDVFKYTKNVILLVGSKYHTRDVIDRDIEIGLEHADLLEVNVMQDSFSPVKLASPEMVAYVYEKWAPILRNNPKVVFTEDPATAWGADINIKDKQVIPIKSIS